MRSLIIIAAILVLTRTSAQTVSADSAGRILLGKEYGLWQATTDSERVCRLTEKALVYRQLKNYTAAIKEIERGVTYVDETSDCSIKWRYEALMNYFLANKFEKASGILDNFSVAQSKKIQKQKEYYYLRWGTFTETAQLQKCKDEMVFLCESIGNESLANEIKDLPVVSKHKSPNKARTMSAVLPGLGSVYAGYPLKGVVSFLADFGLLGLSVFLAVNQLYITAFVSGILPFTKFYMGNVKLADKLAESKTLKNDLELRSIYYQKISLIILNVAK